MSDGPQEAPPPPPPDQQPQQPPPGQPPGEQRPRRRLKWPLIAAIIVIVAAGAGITGWLHLRQPSTSPPFTGVYRADFGPSATDGKPDQDGTPSTGQWAVRSVCRSTGCVATATAAQGPTLQSTFVFDDIGGQWHAVNAASVASPPPGVSGFQGCQFPGEYWTAITLQPRPDGTLAGQYRAAGPSSCETERTVTFTRIGDVDPNSLADPASQPVRVSSPAEAFHGRYHFTQTPADTKYEAMPVDGSVQTDCLRTGERCVSQFSIEENTAKKVGAGGYIFFFADGKWIHNFDGNSTCNGGGSNPTKVDWEFSLPQRPQEPITLLAGHGHKEITGSGPCAGSYNEALTFDGLLLSPDQINTAMGATGMALAENTPVMWDESANLPDKACVPLFGPVEMLAYAGSGSGAVHGQIVGEPTHSREVLPTHQVLQYVVSFSSAHDADAFFTTSAQRWPACSNRQYTHTFGGGAVWTVGPVSNTNGTLSATRIMDAGNVSLTCQRALTVANNVAIDIEACTINGSASLGDAAVNIAHQIAAKVPST